MPLSKQRSNDRPEAAPLSSHCTLRALCSEEVAGGGAFDNQGERLGLHSVSGRCER